MANTTVESRFSFFKQWIALRNFGKKIGGPPIFDAYTEKKKWSDFKPGTTFAKNKNYEGKAENAYVMVKPEKTNNAESSRSDFPKKQEPRSNSRTHEENVRRRRHGRERNPKVHVVHNENERKRERELLLLLLSVCLTGGQRVQ